MGDPVIWNCATGVCCPPRSKEQKAALTRIFMDAGMDEKPATQAAEITAEGFDLAERDALHPLYESWARLRDARG